MNKEDMATKLSDLKIKVDPTPIGATISERLGGKKRLGEKNAFRIVGFLLKQMEKELDQGGEIKLRGIGTISRDGINP